MSHPPHSSPPVLPDRAEPIRRARAQLIEHGALHSGGLVAPWIERSWRRCLAGGLRPDHPLSFDAVSPAAAQAAAEQNQRLVQAARPVLQRLAQALARTGYFAILTNAHGVVVDAQGAIDASDRRALLITRIGTDLSEARVGTTAIGAALTEQQPVWLHRAEHFFVDTSAYSCAGAPLRGPDGALAGMLDLTGIDVPERPELLHLATQAARSIDNALALATPHALTLRLSWPGVAPGGDGDGLLALDSDGGVVAANPTARAMLALEASGRALHADELFAMPHANLFDAARHGQPMDVPLWSGLRMCVLAQRQGMPRADADAPSLKRIEDTLIRQAVDDARGNVALAARRLGISRATLYRKLGRR
jgi:transcriptional regulator of acetoin/glycerol metabolism